MNSETTDAESGKSPEAFRTISEVASDLDVPQHVLRFWESKFAQVKPMKRAGGRRYYRPQDVDLLRGIRTLLYSEGLTIKGVQKILREKGNRAVVEVGQGGEPPLASGVPTAETLAETALRTDEPAFDFAGETQSGPELADEQTPPPPPPPPPTASPPSGGGQLEANGTVIPLSFADRRPSVEADEPLEAGGFALTEEARAALRRRLGELLDLRGELDGARQAARAKLAGAIPNSGGPARRATAREE